MKTTRKRNLSRKRKSKSQMNSKTKYKSKMKPKPNLKIKPKIKYMRGGTLDESDKQRIEPFMRKQLKLEPTMKLNHSYIDMGEFSMLCIKNMTYVNKIQDIKEVFKFTTFENEITFKPLFTGGGNGIICLLTYVVHSIRRKPNEIDASNYHINAILKVSKPDYDTRNSDSSVYEGFVGKYINSQCQYFPLFIETYGTFHVISEPFIEKMVTTDISNKELRENLEKIDVDTKTLWRSLKSPKQYVNLVEQVPNAISILYYVEELITTDYKLFVEFPSLLYQLYKPLSILMREFTHYDLNPNNVLLYKIPNGKYITMSYIDPTNPDNTITFNTQYIVKIIDYARSYTRDSSQILTQLYDELKSGLERTKVDKTVKYTPEELTIYADAMFRQSGLSFEKTFRESHLYIAPNLNNISHDLVLIEYIKVYVFLIISDLFIGHRKIIINETNQEQFNKVKNLTNIVYDTNYGTPPLESMPSTNNSEPIRNVSDAERRITEYLSSPYFKTENTNNPEFTPENCFGRMNIYIDRTRHIEFIQNL